MNQPEAEGFLIGGGSRFTFQELQFIIPQFESDFMLRWFVNVHWAAFILLFRFH